MFDIGFQELGILFLIGLLVLGPERLPRVARTLGAYAAKARRTWNTVRRDIENELAAEDLKRQARESMDTVRSVGEELSRSVSAEGTDPLQDPAKKSRSTNESDA